MLRYRDSGAARIEIVPALSAAGGFLVMALAGAALLRGGEIAGAPEPPEPAAVSPLGAAEQLAAFTAPPGFQVELVAAEPDGGKFVAVAFDHAGRLWTMTALEYPVDANDSPAEARALYERGGRDRILVFDTPAAPGRQKPRVFAEGLAIPLGLLPYRDGAFAQYGSEVRFYRDADGDGRAEERQTVLSGFGVEDSHLLPHQFTRAPGGWIWLAQGAFNYSKVSTQSGDVVSFNKTKLARFRPDGSRFEVIGWGPCNIWGLVIDRFGEAFIQEANDQRWPMMPFLEGASYPLCGDDVPRPYAPPFPKTGERDMGGTGLSGLAFSEGADSFPEPWRDVFFVANPITQRIQAIRLYRGGAADTRGEFGNGWRLEHLPDFVRSGDPWFRPVALSFGPDGCLYIVDWYNKIISHNEVPRNHPERDRFRGRIWRVRHESQPHRAAAPDLYRASDLELIEHLRAANTWEVNAAWQEIVDRKAIALAPDLAGLLANDSEPADLRIRALWCLEGLEELGLDQIEILAASRHRAARKEALRAAAALPGRGRDPGRLARLGEAALGDEDRLVRQEGMRLLAALILDGSLPAARARALAGELLESAVRPPATGGPRFQAYFAAFETYLVRRALENRAGLVAEWMEEAGSAGAEARALGCVSIGGREGARRLAGLLPGLKRGLTGEELLLAASAVPEPAASEALRAALVHPGALRLLYDHRARLAGQEGLASLMESAARALLASDPGEAGKDLVIRLAAGFRLAGLEEELTGLATEAEAGVGRRLAAIRALRECGSARVDLFRRFAAHGNDELRREAVAALAASRAEEAVPALLEVWPLLGTALRKTAIDRLAASPESARQLVDAVGRGAIARAELDGYTLEKLAAVLPGDAALQDLLEEASASMGRVLRLEGGEGDFVDAEIALRGPFTVECWVKLDPGITNQDSILAAPGQLDANFHGSLFRVWVAGPARDIVVASRPIAPEAWTHIAFSRDAGGRFRLYFNGEIDGTSLTVEPRDFEHLRIGYSTASGGTGGELAEFRVWSVCRSADEIRAAANIVLDPTPEAARAGAAGRSGLIHRAAGESWGRLHGKARLERTADLPPLRTEAEAEALSESFARFRALAAKPGDGARGREVFARVCSPCHTVGGEGGKIGPALDGAGAHGPESLLRNLLTPSAAMEGGYRLFLVQTRRNEILEGLLVSRDEEGIVLRRQDAEDTRIPNSAIRRAAFTRLSVMPEGLLEALPPEEVPDLFAYLLTLR